MIKVFRGNQYFERDISWIMFNERVLQEAEDERVPLLERLKFLAIFSSNLDEFFRVRAASVRRMLKMRKRDLPNWQHTPLKVLEEIQQLTARSQEQFNRAFAEIKLTLEEKGVFLIDETQLLPEQHAQVRDYFNQEVQSYLFPVVVDEKFTFPFMRDKSIYLFVEMRMDDPKAKPGMAVMEVPADILGRFFRMKGDDGKQYVMLLEDVIRYNLASLFHIFDYTQFRAWTIKLTRDAEIDIDDENPDQLTQISKGLKQRGKGLPVRFVYDRDLPKYALDFLINTLRLSSKSLIPGGRYHNFKDFLDFPKVGAPELRYPDFEPARIASLDQARILFHVMRKRDVLLHHPYQSFDYTIRLLREAAIDPKVQSIKITLYRVARHSNVVNALINAVKNGVNVTVFMELRARFDEESNIYWTNKLIEAGATVHFGKPGQKIHSKICLITRKEEHKRRDYLHLSTGNYNRITAKLYCDHALLTCDERLTNDARTFFNALIFKATSPKFKHLLVAPFNLKTAFIEKIEREIRHAKKGREAFIVAKMNSLVDEEIINKLYEASKAGVTIRLIIRGICCLVPGVPGLSENIEVHSIIGRFLEHARIFWFRNNGLDEMYLSSADWMTRNLNHRIEIAFPIYHAELKKEINEVLQLQWSDNTKARIIDSLQTNPYVFNHLDKVDAQIDFGTYLRSLHQHAT